MLTVYIDFASPDCYLALAPTLAVIKKTGCTVRWLPFRAQKRELPKDSHNPALTASHGRVRCAYNQRMIEHYAGLQGLSLEGLSNPHGSDAALAALLGPETDNTGFVQAAFRAYWEDNADLTSTDLVGKLWTNCCTQPLTVDLKALEQHQLSAEAAGIPNAPAYSTTGQLLIGRAHLPLIQALLSEG